jgi:tetratricopeptide (TPR) repeat protein
MAGKLPIAMVMLVALTLSGCDRLGGKKDENGVSKSMPDFGGVKVVEVEAEGVGPTRNAAILDASFRTGVALRDVQAAKAAAQGLRAADPKDPRGPLYMGMVQEADGKTVEAERDYREAVRLGPGTKEPLQALVRLLSKQGKQAAALQTLDTLVAQEAKNPFPAFLKGEVLASIGRASEAVAAYTIAQQRAPRWWLAYRGLANAMAAKGDFAGAVKLLRGALTNVDEPLPLRAELAAMLERGGQSDAAIAEYEQIYLANPASGLVANNLALLIVTHSKDPARLAKALNVAKTLSGSADAGQRATYAWVLFRSGDATNALPLLESAASGSPGNPVYLYRLGMAQAAVGQKDKARNSLQEALKQGARFDGAQEARDKLQELSRG